MATVIREGSAEEAGFDAARVQTIRERAAEWVADGLTPTLVLVAARRGVVALHEAFGAQTPAPDSPSLTTDAVFPCSSLSKPMTAAALLMLVEEGRVGLNAPVTDYLPDLEGDGVAAIRVHHLLTHTSGYDDIDVLAYAAERQKALAGTLPPTPPTQHPSVQLALAARNGCPLARAPGEGMSYCTSGYELVGEIIRRVSGTSLEAFVAARIFQPLGMTDSSLRLEAHQRERLVKRAPLRNVFGVDLNDEDALDVPWAGGGLKATALDVARFGQALLNGGAYGDARLLSRPTVREMTRSQIPEGVREVGMWENLLPPSYGYGCFVAGQQRWEMNGRLLPEGTFAHGGMGGVSFWVDPVDEVVGVFFSVHVFPGGEATPDVAPLLTAARYQDMVTSAVAD